MRLLYFFLTFLLIIWQSTFCNAQDTRQPEKVKQRSQSVYFEGGGNGLAYSINYDARFKKQRAGLGFRAGFAAFSALGGRHKTVPLMLNFLSGKKRSFFETGIGGTIVDTKDITSEDDKEFLSVVGDHTVIFGAFNIGYRYCPLKSGLMFRANFTPIIIAQDDFIVPSIGLSLGYNF